MKPTLKQIANEAGVSVSTASRILRGDSKRDSKNVQRVMEAAKRLNYPVQAKFASPFYDETNHLMVALITHFHTGEFYASLFHGMDEAAREAGFKLSLFHSESDAESIIAFIQELSFKSYDAAILFLPMLSEEDYREIQEQCPEEFTIISAAAVVNPVLDTVSFDSYRGGHYAGKHFEEHGYKDVGVVLGSTNRNESLLRKSGFTDFVDHHSNMNLVWQFIGDYTVESGRKAYRDYRRKRKKPRAIFLSNDYMTLGFMEEARRDGVIIPEQVALVGYDDLPICSYHYPSISSIHTDYKKLGTSAINLIRDKIKSGEPHQGLLNIVPVNLKERQSS